ncbi:enoyl-CoA hydratase, partial [Paracoccus aestuarii]
MTITTARTDEGLVIITLNEPARRNPVGHAARLDLLAQLVMAEADDCVRGVVLTGAG